MSYTFKVGVIGAGKIADKHLEVIKTIRKFNIVSITSRTYGKANKLAKKYKIKNINNSIREMVNKNKLDCILVFVSAENMFKTLKQVINYNLPFFFEKPAGLSFKETNILADLAKKKKVKNMVGLNRRFYSVFDKGKKFLERKGGIKGIIVEGHERFWKVSKRKNKKVYNNWIFANGIHTFDLLRYFGGEIKKFHSFSNNRGIFKNITISTKFKNNIIGTYVANWNSPGGWSVTLYGEGYTVIFKPLENGLIIDKKFKTKKIKPDEADKKFKPGFLKQMETFKNFISTGNLKMPAQSLSELKKTVEIIKGI
tara:strand:- start:93 stop:1025 length:933 start_codon:yes stop_codon:yes gene_type:complete